MLITTSTGEPIFISGSSDDIERLKSRIESGEIEEIDGFPVESIEIIDKWHLVKEIVNNPVKGRSLRKVDLSDADLRGADLRGADLRGADLSGADLSGADLRGADLRNTKIDEQTKLDPKWRKVWEIVNRGAEGQDLNGTDLSYANLIFANLKDVRLVQAKLTYSRLNHANLIRANLSDADLRNADLTDVNLSGAEVKNTRFGYNKGISESLKRDLEERGAIFEDSPGDRSGVLTRV